MTIDESGEGASLITRHAYHGLTLLVIRALGLVVFKCRWPLAICHSPLATCSLPVNN